MILVIYTHSLTGYVPMSGRPSRPESLKKFHGHIPDLKLRHLKSIFYLLNPFDEESLGSLEDFYEDFFEGFLLKASGDDLSLNRSLYHQLHLLTPQIQSLNCHLLSDWSDYNRPFLFSQWLIQGSPDSPNSGL